MENRLIPLEPGENPLVVRVSQIIFGIVCFVIAVFWFFFNLKSSETDRASWITLILLSGFGIYLVFAGFGKTKRYIELSSEGIKLKRSSLLPTVELKVAYIEKIEFFPLNISFLMKDQRKITLRFGTNYTDIIDNVKNAIIVFAEANNIRSEVNKEEL
ncbi:MAG: hypothetical protein JXL81_11785 [Deltaproteobacteria bacterium]|nr:hypothetical protein [Deltaproteobacteria bacterium]